jgi:hypothetical protein
MEFAVLAMYRLGGDSKALDAEDIAMQCHSISPTTFAWRKYKNQINLELVGFAIRDAKKVKYGSLVSGSHAKGWRLTVPGQLAGRVLDDSYKQDSAGALPGKTRARSVDEKRIEREFKRVVESAAFQEWETNAEASEKARQNLLRINPYTSDDLLEVKKTRLALCRGLNDGVDQFIDYILEQDNE